MLPYIVDNFASPHLLAMLSPSAFIAVSAAIALLEGAGATILSSPDGGALPACPSPFQPFVHAGCFSATGSTGPLLFDSGLPTGNMTVEICTDFCKGIDWFKVLVHFLRLTDIGNNYKYAGLEEGGKCFCGASVRGHQLPDIDCSTPCTGKSTEICGGREGTSIYQDPTFPIINGRDISDYRYVGCYSEGTSGPALAWKQDQLNASSLTPQECLFACKAGGYDFGGVEHATVCYCGVVLGNGSAPINPSSCDLGCPGDSSQGCGGSGALEIYVAKDMGSTQPCGYSSPSKIISKTSSSTSCESEPISHSMTSVSTSCSTKSIFTSYDPKPTHTYQKRSYPQQTDPTTSSHTSMSTSHYTGIQSYPQQTDPTSSHTSVSTSHYTSFQSYPEYSQSGPSSHHTGSLATSHSHKSRATSQSTKSSTSHSIKPSSTSNLTQSWSTSHHSRKHRTTTVHRITTKATTTTASLCTKTVTSVPTPTCEYECENWCSSPLPPFNDLEGCLAAAASCSIQVASCFLHAGYPGSIDCFNFSKLCQSISAYCGGHCPGGDCSLDKCKSQLPPLNGPPPVHTVRTSVVPCSTEIRQAEAMATPIISTVPVPTSSNICIQPNDPSKGYSTSSPVGMIPLPIFTCNNIEVDFNAGNSFKLYTNSSSAECPAYPPSRADSGCKDACDAQYQSCLENYATGCKEGKWVGGVTDTYQQATDKCHDQWVACLTTNKKVPVNDRCISWNSGWSN